MCLGLPKAAIITHSRYLFASYCLFCMGLAVEQDVLYSGGESFMVMVMVRVVYK